MIPVLFGSVWHYVFGIFLFLTACFLILLVLVQRGRGGGLAGAFGGMGGQSAFGTKAGDLFTRITIVVAAFWIVLCILALAILGGGENKFDDKPSIGADTTQGTNAKPQDQKNTGDGT